MNKVPHSEQMQTQKVTVIYGVGGIDMGQTDEITSEDLVETIN